MPQETRREMSASHFAFADHKSGIAQVFLYYVCDATTYSPLFDGQISQIIRFFLTQNQSTQNSRNTSSCCGGDAKGYCALLGAIAITFEKIQI
ncbi:hypothetical protein [Nostoc sp.]|uniref:hypothetical protein n=1 Tax=Nostoc sp. TaxID=1180 RepID=UPI00359341CF